jgi:Chaperone of endosialidase
MSTEFNFPANPALDQIVILPDGGQAQWNGYAWITLGSGSSVDYPITIEKGGTNATTLSDAQLNLIIGLTNIDTAAPATPKYGDRWIRPDNMTEQVWVPNAAGTSGVWINPAGGGGGGGGGGIGLLEDGTVDAPGLAWASEPGLGWFYAGAGEVHMAYQGFKTFEFSTNEAASSISVYPKTAGQGTIWLNSQPATSTDYSIMSLTSNTVSHAIVESIGGTATSKALILNFPTGVQFPDGTIAKPGISFFNEPGLGFYRDSANLVGLSGNLTIQSNDILFPTTELWVNGLDEGSVGLHLNKKTATSGNNIWGETNTLTRWVMVLGSAAAESGGDVGSDLFIGSYHDDGTGIEQPFSINRASGNTTVKSLSISGVAGLNVATNVGITGYAATGAGYLWEAANGASGIASQNFQDAGSGVRNVSVWTGSSVGDTAYQQVLAVPATYTKIRYVVGGIPAVFDFDNNSEAIKSAGSTSWLVSSDETLKENIQPYNSGLNELLAVEPSTYVRKGTTRKEIGGIAQKVQISFPEAVSSDENGLLRLDMGPLNWAVINAIKTLNNSLTVANARITHLETQLAAIHDVLNNL